MSLAIYHKKRDFKQTREPEGKIMREQHSRFVVQRHDASHLHYDFRLEMDGVLKSWAVPKGPSMDPGEKRLAVMVEDHPVDYISFEGTIPKGNYGAGKVKIWDKGTYQVLDPKGKITGERAALKNLKAGELKLLLKGKKLKGQFVLVQLKNDPKNWLLIKKQDEKAKAVAEEAMDDPFVPKSKPGKRSRSKNPVKPMLASIAKEPFNDPDWIFEIKWDGYRAIAETGGKEVRFYSRNGIDFRTSFPSIAKALEKIRIPAILDGEVVSLNKKNIADFQGLQEKAKRDPASIVYMVFDLLELQGKDIRHLPLLDRKMLLEELLQKNKVIRYCGHEEEKGIDFFRKAKTKGWEGMIAKVKDSEYKEGYRSKSWLKIKVIQSTEVAIAGFTAPGGSRKHFGSLVLAGRNGKKWEYRGHVGTGFNEALLASLLKKLKPLITEASPFKEKVPLNGKVTWVQPRLVAEIGYTSITRDKAFRHPVFLRLRDDKTIRQLNDETASA